MKQKRFFIAIDLPKKQKATLGGIITFLEKEYPSLRYEKMEKLHLTLKFLGWTNIPPDKISQALHQTVLRLTPFSLKFIALDFFFSSNFILFADLEKNKLLFNLVSKIEKELKKLGFPKEKRPFKSHISLARGKNKPRSYWKELSNKIMQKQIQLPENFLVSEIVLMESLLSSKGSVYKTYQKLRLGPK